MHAKELFADYQLEQDNYELAVMTVNLIQLTVNSFHQSARGIRNFYCIHNVCLKTFPNIIFTVKMDCVRYGETIYQNKYSDGNKFSLG